MSYFHTCPERARIGKECTPFIDKYTPEGGQDSICLAMHEQCALSQSH